MQKQFVFLNNGPYANRGCEAIIRGTLELFKDHKISYNNIAFFRSSSEMELQNKIDSGKICHYQAFEKNLSLIAKVLRKTGLTNKNNKISEKRIKELIKPSTACFSLGGDNYSLDYGFPKPMIDMDKIILNENKPLFIWGASIGPFTKDPYFEREMVKHLNKATTIFVREEDSLHYLDSLGLEKKLFLMADPAFLMKTKIPTGKKIPTIEPGSLGINLSPIMQKFINKNNSHVWIDMACEFLSILQKKTDRNIYLIPHVSKRGNSDFIFMHELLLRLKNKKNITLIDDIYTAEESKWIISNFHVFCGARTHSTIAALSSCIPTLSLSYSIKSSGINKMIYGSQDYCFPVSSFNPDKTASAILSMVDSRRSISAHIASVLPKVFQLLNSSKLKIIEEIKNYE
ncbi:MAG: polysaccharide pyruvyl transferase family protein [Crenarchaeota archaeon]|nr:polysaccharide pyruvyl transferase family protein [Thermoproteota archaeon]